MKKLIFVLIAALGVSCASYAQMSEKELKKATKAAQKTVKEARDDMERDDVPDKRHAKKLIDDAMKNPLLKDWDQTWYEAAIIYEYFYNQESIKSYNAGVKYDTTALYDYLDKMITFTLRADSLQQIPNEKGKTSNEARNRLFPSIIHRNLNQMITAGVHYFMHHNDAATAYKFFDKYYTIAQREDFADFRESDAVWNENGVKYSYFPALAAFQLEQWENCLKYSQTAQNDDEYGEDATEFICESYGHMGDTVNWLKSLKAGLIKYPTHEWYYGKLLNYYSQRNNMEEMEAFVKEMVAVDPEKAYNYYVLGFVAQQNKDYDKAIEQYKIAVEKDNTLSDAYNNLGLCIMFKAQAFMESKDKLDYRSSEYKKAKAEEKEIYKEALPYAEKLRELEPDNVNKWGALLYQIYYKLEMTKEMKEIEKLIGE